MGEPFTLSLRLEVRACVADDLPHLEWFGLFTPHREILADAFARHERGENPMLVVDLNGFPVGQAWVDLAKRRPRPAGVIWALRVHPCLQGLGLGRRLLDAAEALLHERRFAFAQIQVEKSNPAARTFYQRLGYDLVGEEREAYAFTPPGGKRVHALADLWLLERPLDR